MVLWNYLTKLFIKIHLKMKSLNILKYSWLQTKSVICLQKKGKGKVLSYFPQQSVHVELLPAKNIQRLATVKEKEKFVPAII